MKLAAAYLRKSSKDDAHQCETLEGQRRHISRYAADNRYRIVKWYEETASGLSAEQRKVFRQMLDDARAGKTGFRHLICYDVSRFGRMDNDETGYYRHLLHTWGVQIHYVTDGVQDTHEDGLVIYTKQWLARQYSMKLSEYVLRNVLSRSSKAAQGLCRFSRGGPPPYGYDVAHVDAAGKIRAIVRQMPDSSKHILDAEGRLIRTIPKGGEFRGFGTDHVRLVPSVPERVRTVRKVFQMYVGQAGGSLALAHRLNVLHAAGKFPASPAGGLWSASSVFTILQKEEYLGHTTYNKRWRGRLHRIAGGRVVKLPWVRDRGVTGNRREDWIVLKGTHEAIVDPDLFAKARRKRLANTTAPARTRGPHEKERPFYGIMFCGECGHVYHRWRCKDNGGVIIRYDCSGRRRYGKSVCTTSRSVRLDSFGKVLIGALAAELERFAGPRPTTRRRSGPSTARRKRRTRVGRKRLPSQPERGPQDPVGRILALAGDLPRAWERAAPKEEGEILRALLDRITINSAKGKARIHPSRAFLQAREAMSLDGTGCVRGQAAGCLQIEIPLPRARSRR